MSEEHFQSPSINNLFLNNSCTEQCFLTWTIKNFSNRMFDKDKPSSIGTLTFSPSEKEYSTLWLLELSRSESETLELSVTLLDSKYLPKVFMRFCAAVHCREERKFVPLSIHSDFNIGDQMVRTLLEKEDIAHKKCLFLNENLNISCELTVGGQPPVKCIAFKTREKSSQIQRNISRYVGNEHRTINTDVYIAMNSEMTLCYNSVVISRDGVLNEFISSDTKDNCLLHMNTCTSKSLYVILNTLYCDVIKFYLNRIKLNKLSDVLDYIKMSDWQNLIHYISYQNNGIIQCVNVTWIIPSFKNLLQRQYVSLYCPGQESGMLLHKLKLQLIISGSQNYVSIYVHNISSNKTPELLKFTVKILQQGKVKFEKSALFYFSLIRTQGWKKCLPKNELCNLLSRSDLVLKCFLEVVNPAQVKEIYNERNFFTRKYSHLMMAIDSFQRHCVGILVYIEQIFKDYLLMVENIDFNTTRRLVVKLFDLINHCFRIHSCILSVHLLPHKSNIYSFLQSINLDLAQPHIAIHLSNIVSALHVLGVERFPGKSFMSEISSYQHALRNNIIEMLSQTTGLHAECHSFVMHEGNNEITRSEPMSPKSALRDDNKEKLLSDSDSSHHSDHDSSFEADNEVKSINENPLRKDSTRKKGKFHAIIVKGGERYVMEGNHYVYYPKPINKKQVPSNPTLNSETACAIKYKSPTHEADSIHSTKISDTGNSSRKPDSRLNSTKKYILNLSKEALVRVISPQYSNRDPSIFNVAGNQSNYGNNNRMNQTANPISNENLLLEHNITQAFANNDVTNTNNSSGINRFRMQQPALQPLHQPALQLLRQPVLQPLRQPALQPLRQPALQPLRQPALQPLHQPALQPMHQPALQPMHQPALQPLHQPLYLTVGNFPSSISSNFINNNYNYSSLGAINQGSSSVVFRSIYPFNFFVQLCLPQTQTHIPIIRNNFIDYVRRENIFPYIQPLNRNIGNYNPESIIMPNMQPSCGSIRNYSSRNTILQNIQSSYGNIGDYNARNAIRLNMQPSYGNIANYNSGNYTLSNNPRSFSNNINYYPRNTSLSNRPRSFRNHGNYYQRNTTESRLQPSYRNHGNYHQRNTTESRLQPSYRNNGNYHHRNTTGLRLQPANINMDDYEPQFLQISNTGVYPNFGTVYQSNLSTSYTCVTYRENFSPSQPISSTNLLVRAPNNFIVNYWPGQYQTQPFLYTRGINIQSNITVTRDLILEHLRPEIVLYEDNASNNSRFETISEPGTSNRRTISENLSQKKEELPKASYNIAESSKLPHWRIFNKGSCTFDSNNEHQAAYDYEHASCTESIQHLTSNKNPFRVEHISTNDMQQEIHVDCEVDVKSELTSTITEKPDMLNESSDSEDLI